ncbi:MAG: GlsB/YeaQ/YmgE family stress response rane protein [Verrucomicrobiaceae bacterium]|nr:GlsB/YeaQ/YmgE family stress response rane protein [Verrucomicrobiaceae bacterium]
MSLMMRTSFFQPYILLIMPSSIIGMIVIGLIVGVIAKLLTPGRDPGGCLVTIILGIVGSFVAGFLGRAVGWYTEGQPAGFIASVIGAILVLLIYRKLSKR